MRSLFRFSIALLGVCCAYSSSQAFWWHHKDRGSNAPAASCETAACAPAVTYMAQTQNVVSTRTVMVPVQQQVVTQRTVLVPVRMAPVAAPMGCTGAPVGAGCTGTPAAAPSGCTGFGAPSGCTGFGASTGCTGGGFGLPGRGEFKSFNEQGSLHDALPPKLAKLETRLYNLENKIDSLTESVNEMRDAKSSLPALPTIPTLPGGKPTPLGSAAPAETDPVLAAARAFKAKQGAIPTTLLPIPPLPAGADAGVTRK